MKSAPIFLLRMVLLSTIAFGQDQKPQATPAQLTIASVVDRQISNIEKEVVEAAEAMPEEKFKFSPES